MAINILREHWCTTKITFLQLCAHSFIVWSDDTWLQEHAGKTIDEKEEEEEEKGTKRSALLAQTVSFNPCAEPEGGGQGVRAPPLENHISVSKQSRP